MRISLKPSGSSLAALDPLSQSHVHYVATFLTPLVHMRSVVLLATPLEVTMRSPRNCFQLLSVANLRLKKKCLDLYTAPPSDPQMS